MPRMSDLRTKLKTKSKTPRILAIETSCDETSTAILSGSTQAPTLEAHFILSHTKKTHPFGGIVPEVVAREHLQHLEPLVAQTLAQSHNTLAHITHIAATCGPGLLGSLVVGTTTAKTLALAQNIPFIPTNHLEGHALSPILSALTESPPQKPPPFPYLLLLVSGGHGLLLLVQQPTSYRVIGQTRDDAPGECLDKCARLLQLPTASGAELEAAAKKGNPTRFADQIIPLPQPMKHAKLHHAQHCDLSFSGLKSALARAIANRTLSKQQRLDGAAAVQKALCDSLIERSDTALRTLAAQNRKPAALAVAGGVAANQTLHARLQCLATKHALPFFCPRRAFCTDNAAMIAYAALVRIELDARKKTSQRQTSSSPLSPLSYPVRPRWSFFDLQQEERDPQKAYVRSLLDVRDVRKKYANKTRSKKTMPTKAHLQTQTKE